MEISLKKELILDKTVCRIIGVSVFALFTILGAFVRITLPFSPVPLTLQTFFVLLSGAILAGNYGGLSQLAYVLLGTAGLPVFSQAGSGILYLLGPTGGYLLGFVLASLLIGRMIKLIPGKVMAVFLLFCLADLILLSFGVLWLKCISGLGFNNCLFIGFLPFLPGDLLKALAAALIYSRIAKRSRQIF